MSRPRSTQLGRALRRTDVSAAVSRLIEGVVRGEGTSGASLYLEGPPGIGKSHLVAAALDTNDVTVLHATGNQEGRHEAFALMAELVSGIPAGVNPAEFVLDRIDALCASGPVAVWVDDAHNADEATLTVLRRIVWSAQALPLAVLITARPLPVRERLQLVASQAQLSLQLPPMDGVMVEQVVFDHLGHWPGPALRNALTAAAGNPLFVVELIRSLRDADLLTADTDRRTVDVAHAQLPRFDGLDRVVRIHLAQLDEATRDLLSTLSVCGAEVPMTELAEIMFAQPQDLIEPLNRAVLAGLVRQTATGQVDFAHDIYREVTYEDLSEDLRRLTHGRVAQLSEGRGAVTVRVAQHRLRSSDGAVEDPQLLAALRAAAASAEQYAPEVAADVLEMADEADAQPDAAALLRRVEDLFLGGRGATAEQLVRERIGSVNDPGVAAELQAILIRHMVYRAEVEGVLALIDQTTSILGLPLGIRATLAAIRSWIQLLGGRPVAVADIDRTRSDLETSGAVDGLATIAVVQGCQAFLDGRPAAALDSFAWIDAMRRSGSVGRFDGTTQVFQPWASMILSGPQVGLSEVRAMRQDQARDARWTDPYLGFLAGAAAMLTAEWDDATAELDPALELADEIGTGWISLPTGLRCYIDAHRGNTGAARLRLEAFRHRGLPLQFGLDFPGIAELAVLEAEGATAAAAMLARSLWSAARVRPGRGITEHVIDIMRIAIMTLQHRVAAQIVEDLSSDLDRAQHQNRDSPEPVARLRAVALCVKGMSAADPDLIAEAAEIFGAQQWNWQQAHALEELACAAATRRERVRASQAADSAIAVYDKVGARTDRDRLLARTRAVGLRRGSRGAQRSGLHGWGSLTATELRVTQLICDGLTNREIGSRLYISPRTVQTHVAHILAKTALRSRVEVATAAAQHLRVSDGRAR